MLKPKELVLRCPVKKGVLKTFAKLSLGLQFY